MATRKSATEPAPEKKKPAKPTKAAAPKATAPQVEAKAPAKPKKKAAVAPPAVEQPTAVLEPKPSRRKAKPEPAVEAPMVEPAPPATPVVAAPVTLDPKASAVFEAIEQGRALEFIFENGDANPPRTFEPRLLCFDALSKAWYAWGWDRRYNAERHHRLDLLREVNAVEGLGRAAQGPFKEGTAANLIGGWLGGEPIPVKAVLMKQWIFAVKQAPPPFPEFHIEDIEDGKAQVTFTATDLRAISRWCMQFGDGIQVQEPQRLVDRIKQVGVAWGGRPKAEPEPSRPAPPPPPPAPAARHSAPPPPQPPPAPPKRENEAKGKGPRVEIRTERL